MFLIAPITPLDIRQKEFNRSFRGYNERQVDKFKEEVASALEELLRENDKLKQRLAECEEQQKRYREIEEVLKNTMVMAQKQAQELKEATHKEIKLMMQDAHQRSEKIIQEAELKAREKITEAKKQVEEIMEEYAALQKQFQAFKIKFKTLLEAQLEALCQNDIFDEAAVTVEKLEKMESSGTNNTGDTTLRGE